MNNGRQVNACLPFDFYMKVYSNHERFLPAYDRTQSVKFKKQQPRSI